MEGGTSEDTISLHSSLKGVGAGHWELKPRSYMRGPSCSNGRDHTQIHACLCSLGIHFSISAGVGCLQLSWKRLCHRGRRRLPEMGGANWRGMPLVYAIAKGHRLFQVDVFASSLTEIHDMIRVLLRLVLCPCPAPALGKPRHNPIVPLSKKRHADLCLETPSNMGFPNVSLFQV